MLNRRRAGAVPPAIHPGVFMLSYREIMESDAELLLGWRASPRVAAGYATSVPRDPDLQRAWIKKAREDMTAYHWIAEYNGCPIGYMRFHHLNREESNCRLNFYIGDEKSAFCYQAMQDHFLYFLFQRLLLTAVISYVLADNERPQRFNDIYGYQRKPDLDCAASGAVGKPSLVYVMERDAWLASRGRRVRERPFPVVLWHGGKMVANKGNPGVWQCPCLKIKSV